MLRYYTLTKLGHFWLSRFEVSVSSPAQTATLPTGQLGISLADTGFVTYTLGSRVFAQVLRPQASLQPIDMAYMTYKGMPNVSVEQMTLLFPSLLLQCSMDGALVISTEKQYLFSTI